MMTLGDILKEAVHNCDCRLRHYWLWDEWFKDNHQIEHLWDKPYFGA